METKLQGHLKALLFAIAIVLGASCARNTSNAEKVHPSQKISKEQEESILQQLLAAEKRGDTLTQNQIILIYTELAKAAYDYKALFTAYRWYGMAYYNRGNYVLSDAYIDKAAHLADSLQLPELRPLKYIELSQKRNIKRTDSAIHFYKLALKDTALLSQKAQAELLFDLSFAYYSSGYYKEAKHYAEQSLHFCKINEANNNSGTKSILNCNSLLFWIAIREKDTVAAQQYLKSSVALVNQFNEKTPPNYHDDLGSYYLLKNMPDSALYYFNILEQETQNTESASSRIRPFLSKAKVYTTTKNYTLALQYINKVADMLHLENPEAQKNVRQYILIDYFTLKHRIEKGLGNTTASLEALEMLKSLTDKQHLAQQSHRLAELEEDLTKARAEKTIAEKEQKIKVQKNSNIALTVASLLAIIIVSLLYLVQRRKKEIATQKIDNMHQQMVIERAQSRLQAEDEERQRISQEIHDDISPSITILNLAAKTISKAKTPQEQEKASQIIHRNTITLNQQLSEIIWSLNSNNDTLANLSAYIRKFADKFMDDAGVQVKFESNITQNETKIVGYKRRTAFLAVKELLNNAVKYSGSKVVALSLLYDNNLLEITVVDFGKGWDENVIFGTGNGFKNMHSNVEKMDGSMLWKNDNGLTVILKFPIDISET